MASDSIGLTAFLVKTDQLAHFETEFPATSPAAIPVAAPLEGYFIPLPTAGREPPWLNAVESLLETPSPERLRTQTPGGILVIRRDERTFIVSFGHAWQRLEDEWLERDFGRRVALNSIAQNGLVEIRSEQVFAKWHISNNRAPRATSVEDFGVEFDRDLVASVEGVPLDKAFGKIVRGGTSLRVNLPIASLAATLDKASKLFKSTTYRHRWPEIDNLSPVRDASLIATLENKLDEELSCPERIKKAVLFTPTYRRDETLAVDSYVFGRMSQTPVLHPYLTIDAWIDYMSISGESPSVASAKSTKVHLLDQSSEELKTSSVFDCLGCELQFAAKTYILSSGVWYEVVRRFLDKINTAVSRIASPTVGLPAWNHVQSEGEYNLECGKRAGFLGFDEKIIHFGGGQSKFEFCDTLHLKSRTMYFAKIASKSSGMSHLVEQVRRTSELCFSADGAFRKRLKTVFTKVYKTEDSTWLESRLRADDWTLCLVRLCQIRN
jgi:uncharacterized protein (TIGR04141 family)